MKLNIILSVGWGRFLGPREQLDERIADISQAGCFVLFQFGSQYIIPLIRRVKIRQSVSRFRAQVRFI